MKHGFASLPFPYVVLFALLFAIVTAPKTTTSAVTNSMRETASGTESALTAEVAIQTSDCAKGSKTPQAICDPQYTSNCGAAHQTPLRASLEGWKVARFEGGTQHGTVRMSPARTQSVTPAASYH